MAVASHPPLTSLKQPSAARLRWLVERWSWNNPPSFAKHLFGLALLVWKPSWIKQETNKDLDLDSDGDGCIMGETESWKQHFLQWTHTEDTCWWGYSMMFSGGWGLRIFFHDVFFCSCYPGRIQVASRGKVNGIAMDHERAMLRSRCDSIVAFLMFFFKCGLRMFLFCTAKA